MTESVGVELMLVRITSAVAVRREPVFVRQRVVVVVQVRITVQNVQLFAIAIGDSDFVHELLGVELVEVDVDLVPLGRRDDPPAVQLALVRALRAGR